MDSSDHADTAIKIVFWYFFSIIAPITNKSVQISFPHTNTLSILLLLTASILGGLICFYRQQVPRGLPVTVHSPKNTFPPLRIIVPDLLPLGLTRFLGMSLLLFGIKNLPVSHVLTLKALDPIPTAVFTYLILGVRESWLVYSTVIPVIFGVFLSTKAEGSASTGWNFVAVMLVVVDSLQGVLSKHLLSKGTYTEVSLQFLSSTIALIFQFPVCIYNDGLEPLLSVLFFSIDFTALFMIVLACLAFYGQVLMAFMVMNKVTNLTYSVANILKRIIQLLVAVLVFQNPISKWNGLGMLLAMFGVSLYTFVRSFKR